MIQNYVSHDSKFVFPLHLCCISTSTSIVKGSSNTKKEHSIRITEHHFLWMNSVKFLLISVKEGIPIEDGVRNDLSKFSTTMDWRITRHRVLIFFFIRMTFGNPHPHWHVSPLFVLFLILNPLFSLVLSQPFINFSLFSLSLNLIFSHFPYFSFFIFSPFVLWFHFTVP